MKKELIKFSYNGDDITLYAVKIREDGTRNVIDGIIIHYDNDEFCKNDFLCGAPDNMPETEEEAEAFMEYAKIAQDVKEFRIDGNGYYLFVD